MKVKILQMLLLFLATGLFVSSKQTNDNFKTNYTALYVQAEVCGEKKKAVNKKEIANYPFALAPGSYIFHY